LESGECINTFIGHTDSVTCIKNVLDNILISGCFDGSLKVWKIANGECLKTINAHSMKVGKIELISNDQIVTCSNDKTIKALINPGNLKLNFLQKYSLLVIR
jgi:WD40 repeat protein